MVADTPPVRRLLCRAMAASLPLVTRPSKRKLQVAAFLFTSTTTTGRSRFSATRSSLGNAGSGILFIWTMLATSWPLMPPGQVIPVPTSKYTSSSATELAARTVPKQLNLRRAGSRFSGCDWGQYSRLPDLLPPAVALSGNGNVVATSIPHVDEVCMCASCIVDFTAVQVLVYNKEDECWEELGGAIFGPSSEPGRVSSQVASLAINHNGMVATIGWGDNDSGSSGSLQLHKEVMIGRSWALFCMNRELRLEQRLCCL